MKVIRLLILLVVLFNTTIIVQAQESSSKPVYYPKLQSDKNDLDKVRADLQNLLNKKNILSTFEKSVNKYQFNRSVLVFDDRIEVQTKSGNIIINFSDFTKFSVMTLYWLSSSDPKQLIPYPIALRLGEPICFYFLKTELEKAKKVADDLFFIQYQQLVVIFENRIVAFKPLAEEYRALKVKPPIPEELRKLIVQANAFNEQKQYFKAIEMYNKAIDLNQTAYPAAYWNIALQYANVKYYQTAIYCMKKYLMLVPEASDARSGQDKIYEWEAQIIK